MEIEKFFNTDIQILEHFLKIIFISIFILSIIFIS